MTHAEYDAALQAWEASLPPGNGPVNVPDFFWRHPLTPSNPEDIIVPTTEWVCVIGLRASDKRPYIGLGVKEIDGSIKEERYHPPGRSRLSALIVRSLQEGE